MSKSGAPLIYALYLLIAFGFEVWGEHHANSKKDAKAKPRAEAPTASYEEDPSPASAGLPCPDGMVRVEGAFCPRVEQRCLRWLDADQDAGANGGIGPMRCAEFAPSVCLSKERRREAFCLDRFEWPNVEGGWPSVAETWEQAKASCAGVGKRLCTADEWTFACEGEGMKPYPYGDGLHRDELACDQGHEPMPDPATPEAKWPLYYHAHRSGSMPKCSSPFGAMDMVAGVDEWVENVGGSYSKAPYVSGLKGGYSTYKVRTRCRPMTTVHGPGFKYYQIGHRCCR